MASGDGPWELASEAEYMNEHQQDERKTSRSGQWLLRLIRRAFKKYWEMLSAEYFQEAYHTTDRDVIADKLIKMFARNASILGILTGVIMSADEIVLLVTDAEGGLGLPFNIAIAALVLTLETILLLRFQLAMVACLGKLYDVPLDPDDPEDIVTILAFAIGGSAANAAGTAGMKMGGKVVARIAKSVVQKEALSALTGVAERIGIQMLARALVKYAVPVASIAIGMVMNYIATRGVGKLAKKHFQSQHDHSSLT
jgi:uncharacterized protein (DUF697 family)